MGCYQIQLVIKRLSCCLEVQCNQLVGIETRILTSSSHHAPLWRRRHKRFNLDVQRSNWRGKAAARLAVVYSSSRLSRSPHDNDWLVTPLVGRFWPVMGHPLA